MNIAIWGAGQFGQFIVSQLLNDGLNQVVFFIDKKEALLDEKIRGIDVINVSKIKERISEKKVDVVLIAFLGAFGEYEYFRKLGLDNIGIICDKVFEDKLKFGGQIQTDKNIIWVTRNKPMIDMLQTQVVDYCNLNCKGCSHFSPLYEYGEKIPFEVFCRDLNYISDKIWVKQFDLLGGEPLLEKKIVDYICFARDKFKFSKINVCTNGLLIKGVGSDFFNYVRELDINIMITDYIPTHYEKERIEAVLQESKVKYSFSEYRTVFKKNLDLNGNNNMHKAFHDCRMKKCHMLRDGMIYTCPVIALGKRLNEYFGTDIVFGEGVDIYDNLDWERIVYHLENDPIDLCRYCGVEKEFTWEITGDPKIDDWSI